MLGDLRAKRTVIDEITVVVSEMEVVRETEHCGGAGSLFDA